MYLKKPLKKGFPLRLTVLSEIRKFWEPLKVFRKKLTRNWQNTVKMIDVKKFTFLGSDLGSWEHKKQ